MDQQPIPLAAPRRTLLRGLAGLGAAAVAGRAMSGGAAEASVRSGGRTLRRSTAVKLGLASPGLPFNGDAFLTTASTLAYRPVSGTSYVAWSLQGDFPVDQVRALAGYGSIPVITWEPWDPAAGVVQPLYRHAAIEGGLHDAYLTRWAQQIKAYGGRVVLRLMQRATAPGTRGASA